MISSQEAWHSAIAIVAHPDDIEFLFAGTLLQLGRVGYELHYFCLANGGCGSLTMDAQATVKLRRSEAKQAAVILGAKWHGPLCNDLEIIYSVDLIKRLAVTIRETRPEIVLTHSPDDYMADHTETARLAITAAFTHGMKYGRGYKMMKDAKEKGGFKESELKDNPTLRNLEREIRENVLDATDAYSLVVTDAAELDGLPADALAAAQAAAAADGLSGYQLK